MGGILEVAGIKGFLGNVDELRAETQDTTNADFIHAVREAKGDAEFAAREVVAIARELLSLGDMPDQVFAQRLGSRLRGMKDRPMAGLVLRQGGKTHGGARAWRVVEAAGAGTDSPNSPNSPPTLGFTPGSGEDGEDGEAHPDLVEPLELVAEAVEESLDGEPAPDGELLAGPFRRREQAEASAQVFTERGIPALVEGEVRGFVVRERAA